MLQLAPLAPSASGEGPRAFFPQHRAYVFAFAVPAAPLLTREIVPGEIVTVAVADGVRAPHDPRDWFAARVTVRCAVTRPRHG